MRFEELYLAYEKECSLDNSSPGERVAVEGVRRIVADPPGVLLSMGDDSAFAIGVVGVTAKAVADFLP